MYAPGRRDVAALLRLATPIVAIQGGMMLMGVVDTIMVGQLSAEALAAVAIANIYYFGITVFGIGALLALDPIVAQALGANDFPAVQRGLQRGLVLSFLLSVPIMALLLAVEPVLRLAQQPEEIVPIAAAGVVAAVVVRENHMHMEAVRARAEMAARKQAEQAAQQQAGQAETQMLKAKLEESQQMLTHLEAANRTLKDSLDKAVAENARLEKRLTELEARVAEILKAHEEKK